MMQYLLAGFPEYFEKDFFQSNWQLTQLCNFHCPYCVNKDLRTTGVHMAPAVMEAALHRIATLKRPKYRFSLSGGEVTLYPYLNDMLSLIARNYPAGTTVNMLSNGSASLRKFQNILATAPKLACRFIITIHIGQTDIDDLIGKLLAFSPEERVRHFSIKLVVPPANETIMDIRRALDDAGLWYDLNPVVDFEKGLLAKGYTEADFTGKLHLPFDRRPWYHYVHEFEDGRRKDVTFLEGLREDLFHYTGMYCCAGRNSIYLDEYGNISKGQFCGRMPYTIMERDPFTDPDFFTPSPCREDFCTCTPFTALPKWRERVHAPEWL